ncbi:MAG: response regulator transcription factor [Xenococcaceae cyanobacterium]
MVINLKTKKILVVDDDPAIRHLISRFFSYNNYQMESAADGKTARKLFKQFNPDVVILDVNLPDDSGFNLCKEMRQTGVLVLMLTCMKDTHYILEGFERGADDYLTKPFNLEILKAKIEALLKRQMPSSPCTTAPKEERLVFNQLAIDSQRREVILKGQLVSLTALEFDLLYFLASHPNRVWERSELILKVWNKNDEIGDRRKVDIHIGRIRQKIGDPDGKLIKTIRGKGYMFDTLTTSEI